MLLIWFFFPYIFWGQVQIISFILFGRTELRKSWIKSGAAKEYNHQSRYGSNNITYCLSQGLYSCTKHHDQEASWGGKGLFSFHFHTAVHHQRKSGQELTEVGTWRQVWMQKPWRSAAYWLACFLPLVCLVCFLIELRTTSPQWTRPSPLDH